MDQTGDNLSIRDSIISQRDDLDISNKNNDSILIGGENNLATNNFGDHVRQQNEYLNQSFKESQKMDEPKLTLAGNEFEKNLISLMMIN